MAGNSHSTRRLRDSGLTKARGFHSVQGMTKQDWAEDLRVAASSGDVRFMTAMLGRVPKDVMRTALPYFEALARAKLEDGKPEEALAVIEQALRIEPDAKDLVAMRERLESARRKAEPAGVEQPAEVVRPAADFDPAKFVDPRLPDDIDQNMVAGLTQHLRRYGDLQSPKNVLQRLDDAHWLDAWDQALARTAGGRVQFRGSELGIFAVRALQHGAAHALAIEEHPLEGRISAGIVQKHFLAAWHARHGDSIRGWSEDERRASFEEFAAAVDLEPASAAPQGTSSDFFVFPNLDHSLLGTGIVAAVRDFRSRNGKPGARVLPAKATIHAMAIEWNYPSRFRLDAMNRFRWSLYPQPLDLPAEHWTARTAPALVGEIDFENFSTTTWDIDLPVQSDGVVHAIVFWFELDLPGTRLSNAPGSSLQCIRPAVQYTDALRVAGGAKLPLHVRVTDTRIHFHTTPPCAQHRSHSLPSWYFPMVLDERRNETYQDALNAALASSSATRVLDIGAGSGLLSMMAAAAGATEVIGCESSAAICKAGEEVVRDNGFARNVKIVGKDCRQLTVPADLPGRADLAVFELFDCSLLGEGVLHFLEYAREHLLAPGARYLPMSATLRAMIVEYRVDHVLGIDVNLLNPYRFSASFINVDANRLKYRPLSPAFEVFSFDFATATAAAAQTDLRIEANAAGTAGAVLFWFDLQLDDTRSLSNAPDSPHPLHWKQGLQFLPEVAVRAGMQLPIVASHNGSSLKFQWKPDQLSKDAFSTLPRFDPRAWQRAAELDQQNRNLLQHCMQNPAEYAKVAEVAQRFAIDPAAHGLDPVIAQRFAGMFFAA